MTTLLLSFLLFLLGVNLVFMIALVIGFFFKVPYVPSSKAQIEKMITLAEITAEDAIVDLGCGDGKILHMIEKKYPQATLVGYEIAPMPIIFFHIKKLLLRSKAKLYTKDFMKEDFSKYTVVFLYLLPETLEKLLPKLKNELPKGSRVISNIFTFKSLAPTKILDPEQKMKSVYLYQF